MSPTTRTLIATKIQPNENESMPLSKPTSMASAAP
eukprot:CAMPEP_0171886308 /NCGR_PEP_ID=MMETSP0992-20121227/41820_1 /TAXON_ID=483369 /ORGANISM="non described non described, Strain CCMP2098" /LENGTH=34 /DNA_ID= /DNA_START= /DNA_END= /DNA_ORIENTATION=